MTITYILAIVAVNVVFLYLRQVTPNNTRMITGMHIFFGTVQLIYVVPKIIGNFRNKDS